MIMMDLQVNYIEYVQSFFNFIPRDYLKLLNYLDTAWFYLGLIILVLLFEKRTDKIKQVAFLSLTSAFMNHFLKAIFSIPRPPGEIALVNISSPSFPSGAAQGAILFYLVIFRGLDRPWRIIGLVLSFILCLSRIILGVHYFTDILGGVLVGGLLYFLYEKISAKKWVLVLVSFLLALSTKVWT